MDGWLPLGPTGLTAPGPEGWTEGFVGAVVGALFEGVAEGFPGSIVPFESPPHAGERAIRDVSTIPRAIVFIGIGR